MTSKKMFILAMVGLFVVAAWPCNSVFAGYLYGVGDHHPWGIAPTDGSEALVRSNAQGTVIETLWLDSRCPSGPSRVQGTIPLQVGVLYDVKIEGTYSAWSVGTWQSLGPCPCSVPEDSPQFPSPGVTNGPVALDAAYTFAWPKASPTPCPLYPSGVPIRRENLQFSLDGGNAWFPASPIEPTFNPDHIYTYVLEGTGHPLHAQVYTHPSSDDYGQLRIIIVPEPGTILLVGLGGLFLRRRKR